MYLQSYYFHKKRKMLPTFSDFSDVIFNKDQRDLWYNSQIVPIRERKGRKGTYAFGCLKYKCFKSSNGYNMRGKMLPEETPVYKYGFPTSAKFSVPHGAFVYKCQLPGFDLKDPSTIEEKIFSYKDTTLRRSTKKKLKLRCDKFYRIVLLKPKVKTLWCYIFGTNIRVAAHRIPEWMRRSTVVLPNPMRTSRAAVSNKYGFTLKIARPKLGNCTIGSIRMVCTKVGGICKVRFEEKYFYAHASVVFPI